MKLLLHSDWLTFSSHFLHKAAECREVCVAPQRGRVLLCLLPHSANGRRWRLILGVLALEYGVNWVVKTFHQGRGLVRYWKEKVEAMILGVSFHDTQIGSRGGRTTSHQRDQVYHSLRSATKEEDSPKFSKEDFKSIVQADTGMEYHPKYIGQLLGIYSYMQYVLNMELISRERLKYTDESCFDEKKLLLMCSADPSQDPIFCNVREGTTTGQVWLDYIKEAASTGYLMETYGFAIWFLPKYSPELNPCEIVFSYMKSKCRKYWLRMEDLLGRMMTAATKVTSEYIQHLYNKAIFSWREGNVDLVF